MNRMLRSAIALVALLGAAGSAAAAEYVLATGVARPQGERSEMVSMLGVRQLLAGGLFGEASVSRTPAGPCVSTLAYTRPWSHLRTGAGVLALRANDQSHPDRPLAIAAAGFQLGCGLQLPLSSGLGVDLDARYVFFQRPEGRAAPDRFATRYWTFTLGIAVLGEAPPRR